jgi:large subunit ribosomal protein L15
MQQHELRPPKGATHKRKRVGRGNASGHGTYSTRGMKGQKARAGGGVRPGFEGGQLPFIRRMARKRGFTNAFRVDYEEVNVGDLARFAAGSQVTVQALRDARLIRRKRPVKVLGEGELQVALTVEADSFSRSAREKIEAAGGSVRWIGGEPEKDEEAEQEASSAGQEAVETDDDDGAGS